MSAALPAVTGYRYPLAAENAHPDDRKVLAEWLADPQLHRLTQGSLVQKFEEAFADYVERPYAVFVNSGSSALLLACAAVEGGRVSGKCAAVPLLAWATTLSAPYWCGYDLLAEAPTLATWAAVPTRSVPLRLVVHVLGVPAARFTLTESRRLSTVVIEDCCAALGSRFPGGQPVGTMGDMACWSFYWAHQVTTVEGGMVTTDDPILYERLLMLREHGWSRGCTPACREALEKRRGVTAFRRDFTFYLPGFNVRGDEMRAFLGLRGLKRFKEAGAAARIRNDAIYRERLGGRTAPALLQAPLQGSTTCSIAVGVLIPEARARERVLSALQGAGVETRPVGTGSAFRQPFDRYLRLMDGVTLHRGKLHYPTCDDFDDAFQLPNGPHLSEKDVRTICDVVLQAGGNR